MYACSGNTIPEQVYVESLFICLFMRMDDCETHESVN
mgnify:FL=1